MFWLHATFKCYKIRFKPFVSLIMFSVNLLTQMTVVVAKAKIKALSQRDY